MDAYTALRARVEAFNVARERERALAALEGNSPRTSIEVVEREREGMVTSESSNSLAVVGERPRSATSSFEVPEVEEAAQVATAAQTRAQAQEFAQYTDLDLLLARLEGDQVVGTNFEVRFPLPTFLSCLPADPFSLHPRPTLCRTSTFSGK